MIKVDIESMTVRCVCGHDNIFMDLEDVQAELLTTCDGCGKNMVVLVSVSVEDIKGSWIN